MSDHDGETLHHEGLTAELYSELHNAVPDQVENVMSQPYCEIEPSFLGFIDTYHDLARLIPKHWTIIDLGCYVSAQAWYFRDHYRYIGVDAPNRQTRPRSTELIRFQFDNTTPVTAWIADYIKKWDGKDTSQVFAICSYVPLRDEEQAEVRRIFTNLYMYYPSGCTQRTRKSP